MKGMTMRFHAVELIVSGQINEAMNEYNRKRKRKINYEALLAPLAELAD